MRLTGFCPLAATIGLCQGTAALAETELFRDALVGETDSAPSAPWRVESGEWMYTEEGLVGTDCRGGYVARGYDDGGVAISVRTPRWGVSFYDD